MSNHQIGVVWTCRTSFQHPKISWNSSLQTVWNMWWVSSVLDFYVFWGAWLFSLEHHLGNMFGTLLQSLWPLGNQKWSVVRKPCIWWFLPMNCFPQKTLNHQQYDSWPAVDMFHTCHSDNGSLRSDIPFIPDWFRFPDPDFLAHELIPRQLGIV